ncbi:MAG TPA: PfkB family carbohydrate kinase [Streptosporangiaceae bacterium]
MILSIALNPALHVDYAGNEVQLGGDNAVTRVRNCAGGRGLTVARLLHTFGHEVTAAGLAGGSAGELIRADLARAGVATRFTHIGAETRRVVRVADTAARSATTFREPAPYITTEELGRLAADYRGLLDGATAVVLCGSLPAGLPPDIYGSLISYAASAGVPVVLDAGGPELQYGAARGPALVIPEPGDEADLQRVGASAVVCATGPGLRALTPQGRWQADVREPSETARPSRDGLVAGFVPGTALGWSWPDMLRHALALASSVSPDGEVDLDAYELVLSGVTVTRSE